jgi:tRNA(Ile)-lysidine synthase
MRGAHRERALERALAESVQARPGEVLVAAVSGGSDSVALAALLERAAQAGGARLVVAHVNHATRAGSWQDEGVVLAVGSQLGARVVVAELEPGPTSEARLRRARYAALTGLARAVAGRRLFTAHHAEDQTETVLLALFRGTGPSGLAGIPPVRRLNRELSVERPLLGIAKADLAEYVAFRRLPAVVDPTNADLGYRRNAVRAALVELRHSFSGLDEAVARCAAIAAAERAGIERARLRRHLRQELGAVLGEHRDVSFEHLDAAARGIEAGRPGRHFLRPGLALVVERP